MYESECDGVDRAQGDRVCLCVCVHMYVFVLALVGFKLRTSTLS